MTYSLQKGRRNTRNSLRARYIKGDGGQSCSFRVGYIGLQIKGPKTREGTWIEATRENGWALYFLIGYDDGGDDNDNSKIYNDSSKFKNL